MRASTAVLGSLLLLSFMANEAAGQVTFETGDVVVARSFGMATGVTVRWLSRFNAQGIPQPDIYSSGGLPGALLPGDMEFSASGVLHAAAQYPPQVVRISPSGIFTKIYPQDTSNPDYVQGIVFAPDGTLWVSTGDTFAPGYIINWAIVGLRPDGSIAARYSFPRYPPLLGFGGDSCVLYVMHGNFLGAFDVCRGVELQDIFSLDGLGPPFPLSDGTFLVLKDGRITQIDATGSLLRRFPVTATAFHLDATGTAVWVVSGDGNTTAAVLTKVDLGTGALLAGPIELVEAIPGANGWRTQVDQFVVNGAARNVAVPIPALEPWVLAVLAIVLAGCGVLFARR